MNQVDQDVMRKSDDFPNEARITIDYTKGSIEFEHIIKQKGRFWTAYYLIYPTLLSFSLYALCLLSPLAFILPFYSINLYVRGYIDYTSMILILKALFLSAYFMLLLPLIAFPLTYSKTFCKNVFPKIGKVCHAFTEETHTYLITDLKEPVFIIPHFKNAYLSYECHGNYDAYLQKVQIRESPLWKYQKEKKSYWHCQHWEAVFTFSKTPKTGYMEIEAL